MLFSVNTFKSILLGATCQGACSRVNHAALLGLHRTAKSLGSKTKMEFSGFERFLALSKTAEPGSVKHCARNAKTILRKL